MPHSRFFSISEMSSGQAWGFNVTPDCNVHIEWSAYTNVGMLSVLLDHSKPPTGSHRRSDAWLAE